MNRGAKVGISAVIAAIAITAASSLIQQPAPQSNQNTIEQLTIPSTAPSTTPATTASTTTSSTKMQAHCSGSARCISGTVTRIVDGDTIHVDGQSIRFSLASAPEIGESGGTTAKNFVEEVCPVGSDVIVDEDDLQTQGSYGRILGVVYCNGVNLNEAIIAQGHGYLASGFCNTSEFATQIWAKKYGCSKVTVTEPQVTQPIKPKPKCDPSYPDVCIPPYPPDLDCGEISYKKFRVVPPDPHGFDRDGDGIGCES